MAELKTKTMNPDQEWVEYNDFKKLVKDLLLICSKEQTYNGNNSNSTPQEEKLLWPNILYQDVSEEKWDAYMKRSENNTKLKNMNFSKSLEEIKNIVDNIHENIGEDKFDTLFLRKPEVYLQYKRNYWQNPHQQGNPYEREQNVVKYLETRKNNIVLPFPLRKILIEAVVETNINEHRRKIENYTNYFNAFEIEKIMSISPNYEKEKVDLEETFLSRFKENENEWKKDIIRRMEEHVNAHINQGETTSKDKMEILSERLKKKSSPGEIYNFGKLGLRLNERIQQNLKNMFPTWFNTEVVNNNIDICVLIKNLEDLMDQLLNNDVKYLSFKNLIHQMIDYINRSKDCQKIKDQALEA